LVSFAQLVKESGMPPFRVRLALGEAGELVRVFSRIGLNGREDRRTKLYPLKYTLALLKGEGEVERQVAPEVEADERVPLERVVAKLGWSMNTVKRYLTAAKRLVHTFPDPQDNRKKLYPLKTTASLLRREHGRVQARRLRMKDEGAGYWSALASLKVTAVRLRQVSREAAAISGELGAVFQGLRRRPPLVVEVNKLPDPGLDLVHALTVVVAPLRLVYWKATVPDIPLRGEATTPEEAVTNLREKIAEKFRQLQLQPAQEPDLWQLLNEFIRVRRLRRKSEKVGG
jgi:hypothetical protein